MEIKFGYKYIKLEVWETDLNQLCNIKDKKEVGFTCHQNLVDWFDYVLWHINPCRLPNPASWFVRE